MTKSAGLFIAAQILLTSCASVWAGKPPPCPSPSSDAVDQLEVVQQSEVADSLMIWIGELERYCSGIDAMRK